MNTKFSEKTVKFSDNCGPYFYMDCAGNRVQLITAFNSILLDQDDVDVLTNLLKDFKKRMEHKNDNQT